MGGHSSSLAWKVVLMAALIVLIGASLWIKAPRRTISGAELRRLVLSALAIYGAGGLATLTHHRSLAGMLYVTGIAVCALAAWLSRGHGPDGPPWDQAPADEWPPPEPDGVPWVDWTAFERDFRSYASKRSPAPR